MCGSASMRVEVQEPLAMAIACRRSGVRLLVAVMVMAKVLAWDRRGCERWCRRDHSEWGVAFFTGYGGVSGDGGLRCGDGAASWSYCSRGGEVAVTLCWRRLLFKYNCSSTAAACASRRSWSCRGGAAAEKAGFFAVTASARRSVER